MIFNSIFIGISSKNYYICIDTTFDLSCYPILKPFSDARIRFFIIHSVALVGAYYFILDLSEYLY